MTLPQTTNTTAAEKFIIAFMCITVLPVACLLAHLHHNKEYHDEFRGLLDGFASLATVAFIIFSLICTFAFYMKQRVFLYQPIPLPLMKDGT